MLKEVMLIKKKNYVQGNSSYLFIQNDMSDNKFTYHSLGSQKSSSSWSTLIIYLVALFLYNEKKYDNTSVGKFFSQ